MRKFSRIIIPGAHPCTDFGQIGDPSGTENFESPPFKNLEKKPCLAQYAENIGYFQYTLYIFNFYFLIGLLLGGALTLTWYTYYMCLPFRVLFTEIWYSDRWVFIRDEEAKI